MDDFIAGVYLGDRHHRSARDGDRTGRPSILRRSEAVIGVRGLSNTRLNLMRSQSVHSGHLITASVGKGSPSDLDRAVLSEHVAEGNTAVDAGSA